MLNLNRYIESVVKYVLFFDAQYNNEYRDFLILDNLNGTGMANYLISCEVEQKTNLLSQRSENAECRSDYEVIQTDESSNMLYSFDYLLSSRNTKNISYQNVICKNYRACQLVFIEVPFSKLLFEKIVLLSERSFPVFKFEEICLICKHWYSLWEMKELLAYVLCVYLQNHKDLTFELKACVEYPQHDSYDQQTKFLSSVIFAENYTEHCIRGVIESSVKFGLMNKYTKIIDAYGNLQCRGSICHEIYLGELKIGFLFKYLNISYECLRENDDQLYEIFERKVNKSLISIRIYGIKNTKQAYINCSWIERKNIQRKIALIRNSSFINSEVVSEIVLQLSHWKVNVKQRLFDDIKILKQMECEYCSLSFINSIPKNINIKMHLCSDIITEEILKNVIEASYENCLFKNDLIIPDHIRVELINCRFDNDRFIAFSAGCDDFTVNGGTLKIKSFAMIGLGEVLLHNSFLRFSRKNKFSEGLLELTDIKINRTIRLEKNIQRIVLTRIIIQPEFEIIFTAKNEYLDISESYGMFNLKLHIGLVQQLDENMAIKISPIANKYSKLSYIILTNICFTENLVLLGNYQKVELNCVSSITKNMLVVNKSCKTLIINRCNCAIDVRNVENFDRIEMNCSMHKGDNVKFIGSICTSSLLLCNIFRNANSVESLFKISTKIKHLHFTNDYTDEANKLSRMFLPNMKSNSALNNRRKTQLSLLAAYTKQTNYFFSIYERSNNVINHILKKILNEPVMATLIKLEFDSIVVSENNSKAFKTLQELKTLKICTETITNEFFEQLPSTLELLDISSSNFYGCFPSVEYKTQDENSMFFHNTIKVLIVDLNVFLAIRSIGALFPLLKILKICCKSVPEICYSAYDGKIKLQKLYVECCYDYHQSDTKSLEQWVFNNIVGELVKCIDFDSLECFIIVSNAEIVSIDPINHTILFTRPRTAPDKSGEMITFEDFY